ncbi:MAG TPA: protein phosphatase 2C domain-containing protein [Candidatus Sulfotelmatobacter sp.]|nr:protein phosphatase 2C domain-containing protein [Candidatus Sulfotelmatobacter sp.]
MTAIFETVRGNPENQDCGAIIRNGSSRVLVVADGAGGLSGGREAAVMVVDLVRQGAAALNSPESCVILLQNADKAIARDRTAGETTCVLAVVTDDTVYGASVGDSEAWLICENGVTDFTKRQVRKPFLGSGRASPVGFSHKMGVGEKLLLATDGLFKYTSPERIESVCRTSALGLVAKQLIELVRYPSGAMPDDVTIILGVK